MGLTCLFVIGGAIAAGIFGGYVGSLVTVCDVLSVASSSYSYSHISSDSASFIN